MIIQNDCWKSIVRPRNINYLTYYIIVIQSWSVKDTAKSRASEQRALVSHGVNDFPYWSAKVFHEIHSFRARALTYHKATDFFHYWSTEIFLYHNCFITVKLVNIDRQWFFHVFHVIFYSALNLTITRYQTSMTINFSSLLLLTPIQINWD